MRQCVMHNPWLELPSEPPYILAADRHSITSLSNRLSGKSHIDSKVNDQSIPEPFIGSPEAATVILLNLNPGDSPDDPNSHKNPQFREAMIRNLHHQAQDYPFYALNPAF